MTRQGLLQTQMGHDFNEKFVSDTGRFELILSHISKFYTIFSFYITRSVL